MIQVSHSRVETYKQCPYKFYLRYVSKVEMLPDYEDAANPLVIGTALHTGIEKDVKSAIEEYFNYYPVITDEHINEEIKLRAVIPMCRDLLPNKNCEFERPIDCPEFIGFMDCLVKVGENTYDLYDFKYSNNKDRYKESGQLHEYKWWFERCNPGLHIRKMYFLFAPKVAIRKKKKPREETQEEFRLWLKDELSKVRAELVEIPYNPDKVKQFLADAQECRTATRFDKKPSRLCDWCEFQQLCEKGDLTMVLPKNERRTEPEKGFKRIWIYGLPFSGKTYLSNKFPNVLMLNTDGNVNNVDAPVVPIRDVVTADGRIVKRKYAWDVFKEAITELEKGSDFETIVVDLLEDTYEYCRQWSYDHLGIEHESDNSFKAYDFVRTEFLATLKRLMNLSYNIVLISHEDTSKDITKRSGDKITAIKPNINEKVALKVAGMTDIVARAINDEGKRTLSFKTNEVVFGGGRISLKVSEIPTDFDEFVNLIGGIGHKSKSKAKAAPIEQSAALEDVTVSVQITPEKSSEVAEKSSVTETAEKVSVAQTAETPETTAPVRRRRVRGEQNNG